MRAQEIYEKLLAANIGQPYANFPSESVIVGIQALRNRLETLEGIPGFAGIEKSLKESILWRTTAAQISIPSEEWKKLRSLIDLYDAELRGLKDYLQAVLSVQDTSAVFIKLPESTALRETIQVLDKIAKSLEQVILHDGVGGSLKLKSWENGSLWMEIAVGGPSVVALVGSLAWSAAVVYKKIQEGRLHAGYVKGLELKNESLQDVVNAQKQMLALMVEGEAKAIASEHIKGEVSPETLERIKFSIKELAELIEKGTEIHPALKAPESVRNLFPNFKNLLGIESKTKLIENKVSPVNT